MVLRKNILITGASSGLGEGMARQYAARGRNLALAARRVDRLETLAAELKKAYPGITVVTRKLDVNDHDQVFAVFEEFREELGSLDRVIVNAGLGKGQRIGTGRFDANRETLQTNFLAAAAQIEAAVGIFRKQKEGHLVVVSSFLALRGVPGNATAYAASKAGISAFAEGTRIELLKTPIKVTTLHPGFIESEMNEDISKLPGAVRAEPGAQALVKAIESETAKAFVPTWPWSVLSKLFPFVPAPLLKKFG
ncbi:short-chain dehydrogenase [Amycolatopsis sp. MJM2582]|uniref:SDR family oxidoreductase n=1 Tax=Amycolatopsis TaxID=1813 RepID=UPI0005032E08|nr:MULTISPECIES: SDR family oxidoreductase [unclassified Amycolatopsis]KFZ77633.1 short-chain dehydrogenase [Amycolatopsis sp. MJM2582]RSN42675.1 short chain dehydrogenase [Amycolatopsis sp. WAC 04197]